MTDRNKVIEWLDFCIRNTDGSICECEMSGCPYLGGSDVGNCFVTLMTDALALLKAQEPKPPAVKENSYGWKFYYCPSCGKEFYQNNRFSFCEKCGQAVKWE